MLSEADPCAPGSLPPDRQPPSRSVRACTCSLCGTLLHDEEAGCAGCGGRTAPGEATLAPAAATVFEAVLQDRPRGVLRQLAWILRVLLAAGETWRAIAFHPETTLRSLRWRSGLLAPAFFALLWGGPSLLLGLTLESYLASETPWFAGWRSLALGLVVPPLYVYLRAQGLHLVVVLQGLARNPFGATFRASAYANATAAPLLLIPLLGPGCFLMAGAALEALALGAAHQLRLSRAVVVEMVLAAACFIGLISATLAATLWWSQGGG